MQAYTYSQPTLIFYLIRPIVSYGLYLLSICSVLLHATNASAQGCSDAGFCTISGLKPGSPHGKMYKNRLKIGAFFGTADYSIKTWGNYLEYGYEFNNKWTANAKLTTLGHFDKLVNVFGLGDLFLSGNYKPFHFLTISFGGKIPLTNGNSIYNHQSLPMDYQSSLGTFDIIAGLTYQYKHLSLNAGLQLPLTQNNNMFASTNLDLFQHIQSTNNFMRAPDLLLRVTYAFILSPKFTITSGLLPIYHLYNDKYISTNRKRGAIAGSKGITLNTNLYVDYKINHRHGLQLSVGAPVLIRKVRPDGLTRHFVVSLEYNIGL